MINYFSSIGLCTLTEATCLTNTVAGLTTVATWEGNNNVGTGFHGIRTCSLGFGETITVGWGDGNVTGPATGVHTNNYTTPGNYTVTVTINSTGPCNGTIIKTYNITVV